MDRCYPSKVARACPSIAAGSGVIEIIDSDNEKANEMDNNLMLHVHVSDSVSTEALGLGIAHWFRLALCVFFSLT